MEDPELDQIRRQRLQQLQSQYGGAGGGGAARPGGAGAGGDGAAQEERARAMEEAKHSILSQVLSQDARARLNTIKLSKPEKGQMVEAMILRMAQTGQVRGQISEQEFIGLMESVNQQIPKSSSTVKFDRRRAALDSDDEL